jgi:ATP-dependent Lon protease
LILSKTILLWQFPRNGYDLSKVMFIATSNTMSSIQPALRDRMEIIKNVWVYYRGKVEIARQHLLPRHLKNMA